jgi:hypothetical protein
MSKPEIIRSNNILRNRKVIDNAKEHKSIPGLLGLLCVSYPCGDIKLPKVPIRIVKPGKFSAVQTFPTSPSGQRLF